MSALASSAGKLLFVKMSPNALSPTKGSKLAAGYDLKAAYDGVIPKRGSALIKTDIQIQLPSGTYGRVAPRSGLALKNKIDVGAGVIDEDYRGNVGVILFNHGDEDFPVAKGDRIAQLICEKICYPEIEEVKELDLTVRGEGGFGSTGVAAAGADVEGKENADPEPVVVADAELMEIVQETVAKRQLVEAVVETETAEGKENAEPEAVVVADSMEIVQEAKKPRVEADVETETAEGTVEIESVKA